MQAAPALHQQCRLHLLPAGHQRGNLRLKRRRFLPSARGLHSLHPGGRSCFASPSPNLADPGPVPVQISRLLRTPELARRLATEGREHVRDNFLHTREARDYLAVFAALDGAARIMAEERAAQA